MAVGHHQVCPPTSAGATSDSGVLTTRSSFRRPIDLTTRILLQPKELVCTRPVAGGAIVPYGDRTDGKCIHSLQQDSSLYISRTSATVRSSSSRDTVASAREARACCMLSGSRFGGIGTIKYNLLSDSCRTSTSRSSGSCSVPSSSARTAFGLFCKFSR